MQKRNAFTLVELLVVIAIIGVLVALLLPAVQAAREAARRIQCSNQVKQIGLGFQLYHDTHQQFPMGGRNYVNCCNSSVRDYWNWTYYIYPYLEQQNLYDNTSDAVVYGTPVPVFYCPSRRQPRVYGSGNRSDYAANAGTSTSASTANGAVVESTQYRVNMASFTDGTAFTILVGEKHLSRLQEGGTNCCSDNEPMVNVGWEIDLMRSGQFPPLSDLKTAANEVQRFGSRHPGGLNAVMVDGSVQHFSWTIDDVLFRNLCNREDGNPVHID
ncbi:MAG: DUF1559 domain-containing protein [Planctomycetales bacterium]|nr:DUF1559 domain-containing protein [Planctomycetales bacterium]